MSRNGWFFWHMYTDETINIRHHVEDIVQCSQNNLIPSYVVGMFDNQKHFPRLGYVRYSRTLGFREGHFMEGTDRMFTSGSCPYNEYCFLFGENVSFRPHNEVPENLRIRVATPTPNEYIYVGTVNIGQEELCGPVINGVCYVNDQGTICSSENQEYKILAYNEG